MKTVEIQTKGHTDIINITPKIQKIIDDEKVKNGVCHLFVIGSTASITTCENDEQLFEDLKEVLQQIAPYKKNWRHHQTWGDDNGAAHIRASLLGPNLCLPIENGKLILGTWQSIVLLDFDTGPRTRKIAITFFKENEKS